MQTKNRRNSRSGNPPVLRLNLGTISAAAEKLHLTQPSLSRSMKRLETDLGQELFDRTRNHVELNEAGRLAVIR